MGRKWLDLAPWNNKTDPAGTNTEGSHAANGGDPEKENYMAHAGPFTPEISADSEPQLVASFPVELLSIEDIYRVAGIVLPRQGYSVHKLVDMLKSAHIRDLSKEMKRAAVLMALDAAGISIEEVRQDAKARQDALNSYEAEQEKLASAEWTRRAEEITQIQAEQERANAHFVARINRNVEAIARDKARFSTWIATKQQEAQSMNEAIDLCLKPQVGELATPPMAEAAAAANTNAALEVKKH